MTVPALPFSAYDDPDAAARAVVPWWAADILANLSAGGSLPQFKATELRFGEFAFDADADAFLAAVHYTIPVGAALSYIGFVVTEAFGPGVAPDATGGLYTNLADARAAAHLFAETHPGLAIGPDGNGLIIGETGEAFNPFKTPAVLTDPIRLVATIPGSVEDVWDQGSMTLFVGYVTA